MSFAELKTELAARGTDYLDGSRPDRYINQAYAELCEEQDWPFLETTVTGTAPLTITYLRQILYVVDSTNDNTLRGTDQRTVQQKDPDITATGTPCDFYLTGSTTLNVWPVDTTSSLTVRYLRFPVELSADADEPLVPSRFQNLIVDGAYIRALQDDDELQQAALLRSQWAEGVYRMQLSLMSRDRFLDRTILDTSPSRNA